MFTKQAENGHADELAVRFICDGIELVRNRKLLPLFAGNPPWRTAADFESKGLIQPSPIFP